MPVEAPDAALNRSRGGLGGWWCSSVRLAPNARCEATAGLIVTMGRRQDRKRAGTVRDARMVVVEPGYHPAGKGEKWVMLGDSVPPSTAEFRVAPCSPGEVVGSRR